jgi:hypothetical protein
VLNVLAMNIVAASGGETIASSAIVGRPAGVGTWNALTGGSSESYLAFRKDRAWATNLFSRKSPLYCEGGAILMSWRSLRIAVISLTVGIITACQKPLLIHRLVVTGNQHSVPLYSDEQTYLDVSHERQQGGVEGVAGDLRNELTARQIDDQTPVRVISRDDNGAVIQIVDGPMKGQSGFIAEQNLD